MKYEHGTYAAYTIDRCRCDDCREANRLYVRALARRIEPAYVGADPAREHVRFLNEHGVGLKQVAKRSGLAHGTLSKLMYGTGERSPSKRIRKATLDRILAVTPRDVADGAKVPAGPTWQLIDEMCSAGVPKSRIAEAIGAGRSLQLSRVSVAARNARAVAALHRRWTTGEIILTRSRTRSGSAPITVIIEPPSAAPVPRERADVSELYLELAEIVEMRNSQPWRREAACRGRPGHIWFPARGDSRMVDAAVKVCRACVVRDECRGAMFDERVGIYAGMSARDRRSLRTQPVEVRRRAACGTNAGYAAHRRRGEDACDPCREAHALYEQHTRPTRARVSA